MSCLTPIQVHHPERAESPRGESYEFSIINISNPSANVNYIPIAIG